MELCRWVLDTLSLHDPLPSTFKISALACVLLSLSLSLLHTRLTLPYLLVLIPCQITFQRAYELHLLRFEIYWTVSSKITLVILFQIFQDKPKKSNTLIEMYIVNYKFSAL